MNGWYALFAPAGTRAEVVDWLNRTFEKVLADPAVREKLRTIGAVAGGGEPAILRKQIEGDLVIYREIAQAFDIRGD
jgi:tripartite-type tricarboxylate transporter receptor subunit TctC